MKNDIIFNEDYFLHYCMHPEQTKNSVFIVSNLGLNCKCMSRFDSSGELSFFEVPEVSNRLMHLQLTFPDLITVYL